MTETEFKSIAAQGYNRIPLTLECPADFDTPLSVYCKLANTVNSYLLESVIGGERFGRYSFIGLPASRLIRVNKFSGEVVENGKTIEHFSGNPLDFLEEFQSRTKAWIPKDFPRFCGGLAGYFGYDTVRYIEPRLSEFSLPDEIGTPDILLLQTEELAVVDTLAGKIHLIVYADPAKKEAYAQAKERLQFLSQQLQQALPTPTDPKTKTSQPEIREFAKADYLAAVARAKQYISAGDMMQVQIGQRIKKPFSASPLALYRSLRKLNPSPYMYYYHFDDFHVIGTSPEILVRQTTTETKDPQKKIIIRPLAGTRPRGNTPEEDIQNEKSLLADPKEIAEHVMLIDLARNDIGRLATKGSVKVTEQLVIERYSHVMHIVSNVEGIIEPGYSNLDVLRATFPAGTLTGAPKVRSMEIIDELEPVKRGVYGGACGYLSFSGEMDLAIAIRTGVIKNGMLYAQAAAGIVADSIPENEWQETENKAKAILLAAQSAEKGNI